MFYAGLDIHAKQITICVLDCQGQIYRRCTLRRTAQIVRFLKQLPGPVHVCYEASTGYGMYYEQEGAGTLLCRQCLSTDPTVDSRCRPAYSRGGSGLHRQSTPLSQQQANWGLLRPDTFYK